MDGGVPAVIRPYLRHVAEVDDEHVGLWRRDFHPRVSRAHIAKVVVASRRAPVRPRCPHKDLEATHVVETQESYTPRLGALSGLSLLQQSQISESGPGICPLLSLQSQCRYSL